MNPHDGPALDLRTDAADCDACKDFMSDKIRRELDLISEALDDAEPAPDEIAGTVSQLPVTPVEWAADIRGRIAEASEADAMTVPEGFDWSGGEPPEPEEGRRDGASTEVDRVAHLLMAEWERVEGKPVNVSYIATFCDLARVVIADRSASPTIGSKPSDDASIGAKSEVVRPEEVGKRLRWWIWSDDQRDLPPGLDELHDTDWDGCPEGEPIAALVWQSSSARRQSPVDSIGSLRSILGLPAGADDEAVRGAVESMVKDVDSARSELLVSLDEMPPGSTLRRVMIARGVMRSARDAYEREARDLHCQVEASQKELRAAQDAVDSLERQVAELREDLAVTRSNLAAADRAGEASRRKVDEVSARVVEMVASFIPNPAAAANSTLLENLTRVEYELADGVKAQATPKRIRARRKAKKPKARTKAKRKGGDGSRDRMRWMRHQDVVGRSLALLAVHLAVCRHRDRFICAHRARRRHVHR